MQLTDYIRDVPDFPKPGILFKDITPLLSSVEALDAAVEQMTAPFREMGIDAVAGAESRGFIFGVPIAQRLGAGFVPIRKPGKLPWKTAKVEYDLEYGKDSLEIHEDAFEAGANVLFVDDVLATGGTSRACCELIEAVGGKVAGVSMLMELTFLPGRSKLEGYPDPHVVIPV